MFPYPKWPQWKPSKAKAKAPARKVAAKKAAPRKAAPKKGGILSAVTSTIRKIAGGNGTKKSNGNGHPKPSSKPFGQAGKALGVSEGRHFKGKLILKMR